MRKVGEFLKKLRKEKNMEQIEVGKALDISRETIRRLEDSTDLPERGNTVRRLVEFYGSNMDSLAAWRRGEKDTHSIIVNDWREQELCRISDMTVAAMNRILASYNLAITRLELKPLESVSGMRDMMVSRVDANEPEKKRKGA